MLPCLSNLCSLHASLESDVENYAAGHCDAIELWLGKVEGWLKSHSVGELKELFAKHGMQTPVASFQGGLLISQGPARQEHWCHFERRLALLKELGVGTLVVAGDIVGPLTQEDLDRATMSLAQAAEKARQADVRLALEFQATATFGNNLQTAAALVGDVGSAHLGLCFDVYHYYVGPSKEEDLGYLTPENLFHVQLCDLVGTPRELASDGDRVLPGDGDFRLEPIVAHLKAIGYRGPVSLELMNPQIWQIPPRQFGEIGITALRKVLGLASMGEEEGSGK
jgi:2-keto-myo-inositol isomerase